MTSHRQFADALVAHLPALRRYAVALTGNPTFGDDLVQDSLERALRQATQLRDISKIAPWLRRILHNLYIDEIRRRQNKGREEDIALLSDHVELSTPASDGLSAGELARAMGRLSVEHREILVLASVEELSYREIAAELGIPLGTVMSRLARARDQLRIFLTHGAAAVIPLPATEKP